jgi:uncharacterized membrane protein YozB (DUF420 family)
MDIPPFSIFSAISELFVTAGVFYVIRRNWTQRPFPFALFLTVALFEALVNVMYMANRSATAASAAPGHAEALSTGMKVFYASHGLLSLGAFLVFVVLGTLAHQEQRAGRWFFRDHPTLTRVFLVIWTISILSGEAIFVLRYLV